MCVLLHFILGRGWLNFRVGKQIGDDLCYLQDGMPLAAGDVQFIGRAALFRIDQPR